jgi:hypothetical protein
MHIVPSGKTLAARFEGLIPKAPLTPRQIATYLVLSAVTAFWSRRLTAP